MFIDGAFVFVGEGDHFIQKCGVSGLGDIFVYRREQPQRVVCPVGGMSGLFHVGGIFRCVLMPGVVGEFDQRQSAAVVYLGGEHEADLFRGHFRCQMDDALDVLDCIPVAVTVAQTAVGERGCS